jgi:hypothetical protein
VVARARNLAMRKPHPGLAPIVSQDFEEIL